ncbi:hypothetical protein PF008_g22926 [Phytophthora fragariae]|uniref:Dynein heavy chain hydrolytic ATP-binding dynein motor region domain-containing protein n=1 Tax=Phytophthora fragariae TaxID=53985 RepID=A0A6G0QSF7_9STRA|nr:hypothetical protein PF008_g22926 [Phytophthora fragariae]
MDVHASRLKYYADKYFEVTEEVREHIASQGIVLAVSELKEHRWCPRKKDYEILVAWKGLEPIEDSWETFLSLLKDIPVLLRASNSHYEYGLRAVKSVLVMAGSLKRANPELNEDVILIRALRDSNIPTFLANDSPLFHAIVLDLFPGTDIPPRSSWMASEISLPFIALEVDCINV